MTARRCEDSQRVIKSPLSYNSSAGHPLGTFNTNVCKKVVFSFDKALTQMGIKSDFTFDEYEEMHQQYLMMKAEEIKNQEKKHINKKGNGDQTKQKKSRIGSCCIL